MDLVENRLEQGKGAGVGKAGGYEEPTELDTVLHVAGEGGSQVPWKGELGPAWPSLPGV